MEQLKGFFESALYVLPQYGLLQKVCKEHHWDEKEMIPWLDCGCVDATFGHGLGYKRCKGMELTIFFYLAHKDLPCTEIPIQLHTQEVDGREINPRCIHGPFWANLRKLVGHYNGTDLKKYSKALLLPHIPVQTLVRLVDAYLPIGMRVETTCLECLRLNADNVMLTNG